MFNSLFKSGNKLTRHKRRLMICTQGRLTRNSINRSHHYHRTHNDTTHSTTLNKTVHLVKQNPLYENTSTVCARAHIPSHGALSKDVTHKKFDPPSQKHTQNCPLHHVPRKLTRSYDIVDRDYGTSITQKQFDDLIYQALVLYGPPLPPDMCPTSTAQGTAHTSTFTKSSTLRAAYSSDESVREDAGANGKNFDFYDEVRLRMSEFVDILRKYKPTFTPRSDSGEVPLSLLIKNCTYLRAFKGHVCYMRYVRRAGQGVQCGGPTRASLGIARYKMREIVSADGIRQGPQPWLFRSRG